MLRLCLPPVAPKLHSLFHPRPLQCHKLEDTFGALPVWLAAENGVYLRPPLREGAPLPVSGGRAAGATGAACVDFVPKGVDGGPARPHLY